ncbi:N-acetyl-gamma-glutamyl-phosphate reductase [Pelolinea submarina]|uniref:Putative [LysW]-L-2-aminoadipate 6-phosphate reductase n=1 Tax=Pelolinea submarina TaxID=913107 RepID=A0A347ZSH0_9CHLR|nr:N-acetyl-gamma-glutamyl-phosphate reductase [Pelolinea submarina]REG11182.1 N-acetyl-gamma-glutamyl-phosphate reductase [Pelolinea submarina]BBB48251.1 LysW-gamma-L-alpha-aminoadipyl-6-phosphate/LysW-L-glutamyl-5-phosphate reductase [Pelolinea submarina]
MLNVSIIGGSGYGGGELLRLLLGHPQVQVQQVTSRAHLGEFVYQVHPNLRKHTTLKFCDPAQVEPADILFLALPHGQVQTQIDHYAELAPKIIDLSADFRLKDPALYKKWYGQPHAAPQWLDKFVYGLPEIHRGEIAGASYISGVGCNATASNLALLPLVSADLIDKSAPVYIEIKVGSSESGAAGNAGSLHAERANVIRTFSSFGHRHTAEVIQESGLNDVSLTMTAVDLVRGALATVHTKAKEGIATKDLWKAYRAASNDNPFIRVVKEQRGIYRVPEPKIVAGSNYADISFDLDDNSGHLVSICAIDNLMKGASGSAVQCMNIMMGWDETTGLEFCGLHPY